MATLQVTNLQNTAATVTNVSLLADGTTTLVLNATGTNRTGGLRYNAGNLEVYTSGGVWVAAGGGSGTVTGVTGTLPITVATGTTTPLIAINAATNAAAGAIEIATLAEAATGTDATRASTPETSVPKDASGMTGAALIPTGTTLQRPTPVAGMLRMNTTLNPDSLEVYSATEAAWKQVAYVAKPDPLPADVTIGTGAQTIGPVVQCNNFTVTSGAVITPSTAGTIVIAYGDVTINASTWSFTGLGPVGGSNRNTTSATPGDLGTGYGPGLVVSNGGGGIAYAPSAFLGGSGGAAGVNSTGSSGNSNGGAGGGYIVIKCFGNVTFTGAVTMNAAGANSVSLNGGGGGGGGGGHICIFAANSITTPATVTFNVAGGNASTGNNNGIGAGGGGGGWVILESATLSDSSVKTLTGGLGASTAGALSDGSGGGGGSAGRGGNTLIGGVGQSGGIGLFATSGFPL